MANENNALNLQQERERGPSAIHPRGAAPPSQPWPPRQFSATRPPPCVRAGLSTSGLAAPWWWCWTVSLSASASLLTWSSLFSPACCSAADQPSAAHRAIPPLSLVSSLVNGPLPFFSSAVCLAVAGPAAAAAQLERGRHLGTKKPPPADVMQSKAKFRHQHNARRENFAAAGGNERKEWRRDSRDETEAD